MADSKWGQRVRSSEGRLNLPLTRNFIPTPLHVLLLLCLYVSSRALSKVFEHGNFVACCQWETNHITVAKVAPLVTIDASLQYWPKYSYT